MVAPAMVVVGIYMVGRLGQIYWEKKESRIAAFFTIMFTVLSFHQQTVWRYHQLRHLRWLSRVSAKVHLLVAWTVCGVLNLLDFAII